MLGIHISYNHLDLILHANDSDTHFHPFQLQFFYSELFNMVYYWINWHAFEPFHSEDMSFSYGLYRVIAEFLQKFYVFLWCVLILSAEWKFEPVFFPLIVYLVHFLPDDRSVCMYSAVCVLFFMQLIFIAQVILENILLRNIKILHLERSHLTNISWRPFCWGNISVLFESFQKVFYEFADIDP